MRNLQISLKRRDTRNRITKANQKGAKPIGITGKFKNNYSCNSCEAAFSDETSLKMHVKKYHESTVVVVQDDSKIQMNDYVFDHNEYSSSNY